MLLGGSDVTSIGGKALLVVETVPPHAHLYNVVFCPAKLVTMEMEFGNHCTL